MLILLPPSETKSDGGDGPPLELDRLSFPGLNPARKELAGELVALAADVPASRAALGLSERQDDEIARNAALWSAPTAPALRRYTGVLYDALDAGSLRGAAAARAGERLVVGSALFGLLRAADPVPAYRLSAGSSLPGRGTLAAFWRPALEPVLAGLDGLVVDLRSGGYTGLGRVPGAVTVRVLSERPDGTRTVVSHFNKAAKGRLARLLAGSRAEPNDLPGLLRVIRRAGLAIERGATANELDLIVPDPAG
ncbi:peroxide stress protein YaaA [Pseudonocardia acaciae]|uniref:peroxide stress protein YaaA n=1 Tax=Pseudonocardia acaciae TaxID=551276 RepID=UPI00049100A5|nr:peroxide stress protein YaaA [Pseudonocardia acaciae]